MESYQTMFEVIRQTYNNHGITVADIAEKRVRRHILRNTEILGELSNPDTPEVALPSLCASSFRDISQADLKKVMKTLSFEFGFLVILSPQEYAGMPFVDVVCRRIKKRGT